MYFATSRFLPTAFLTTTATLTSAKRNILTCAAAATAAADSINNNNNNNTFTCLNNNINSSTMMEKFPIGLGTMGIDPIQDVPTAIPSAIEIGYRRIDCAPVYFNEDAIGDALAQVLQSDDSDSIRREDLYIVSKLASPFHRKEHVKLGLQKTLKDLRVDYLDLYLIHWPQAFYFDETMVDLTKRGYDNEDIDDSNNGKNIDPTVSIHETWEAMEELVQEGLVKSIGVSNFPVSLLHELMTKCQIPPAVNQVEAHPYLQQTKLLKYCQARGVHVQAYSPLGTPGYKEKHEPNLLQDPILQSIAKSHNVNVATICIVWALQRGTSIVVKSSSPERQKENFVSMMNDDTNKIILSNEEMEEIASLERNYRFFRPEDWWGEMAMAVFD